MTAGARVAVNASIVGENPTGLGLYTINLVRELDKLRDDLVVYTSVPAALAGLRARVRPITPLVRPDWGMRGHLARVLWLQTIHRVQCRAHGIQLALNTIPEGILDRRVPQVTVAHDLLPLRFPADYSRQQHYFRLYVPGVLRRSRLVIADSESTRRDVLDRYGLAPEMVRVVYPGCHTNGYRSAGARPSMTGTDREPYLLYVGNVKPHKNLLRLLDAFAILLRRRACRLLIRGDGSANHTSAVRERAESLGIANNVTFVGYLPSPALRSLLAGATALVMPSLGEGFGLPVLEAMASRTPVITSRASSLLEVAGDAALLVDPHDVLELAEAMYRMLTDPDLRHDLQERGLERARAFTWRRTGEQVSAILDDVAGWSSGDWGRGRAVESPEGAHAA